MTTPPRRPARDLTVVMPAYNEEGAIDSCLRSWLDVLDGLAISYRVDVWDDGSSDGTAKLLDGYADHPCVRVETKPNEGHGPTILRGYRAAVDESEWVFQVDSDDEMAATSFPELWALTDSADLVLGIRVGRGQPIDRLIMSRIARLTVRLLFSGQATDANVPYRLMRASVLGPIVEQIPLRTFAPNIAISGVMSRRGSRTREVGVPVSTRKTGSASIGGLSAVRPAVTSFVQTVGLARRLR